MSEIKLENCLFCGGSFMNHAAQKLPSGLFAVLCEDCDAMGPLAHTEAEAIAAWNQRTPTEKEQP